MVIRDQDTTLFFSASGGGGGWERGGGAVGAYAGERERKRIPIRGDPCLEIIP